MRNFTEEVKPYLPVYVDLQFRGLNSLKQSWGDRVKSYPGIFGFGAPSLQTHSVKVVRYEGAEKPYPAITFIPQEDFQKAALRSISPMGVNPYKDRLSVIDPFYPELGFQEVRLIAFAAFTDGSITVQLPIRHNFMKY